MQTSIAGIRLIETFEGCKLCGYLDTGLVPTIGWGSTGPHVYAGQQITQAQADAMLDQAVELIEGALNRHVEVPLTQGQFDALVDFCYQFGVGAYLGSQLHQLIQAGEMDRAAHELPRWVHSRDAQGVMQVMPGLVRRRTAELQMWNTGTWDGQGAAEV